MPLLLLVAMLFLVQGKSHAGETFSVLLLHSYHQGYEWTDGINRGILSELDASKYANYEIYVEYMDTKRYKPKDLFSALVRVYRQKYQEKKFDVIIASDDNALGFIMENRQVLFQDAPVVFCGVNSSKDVKRASLHGFTGVTDNKDIVGTIDLALRLKPDTKNIAVLSDNTTTGVVLFGQYRDVAEKYQKSINFIELNNLSHDILESRLKGLPPDTVILLLSLFSTSDKQSYSMQTGINLIVAMTEAPIFILNDVYMGKGVVGGKVQSGFSQGVQAVRLAKLVMNGTNTKDIPIITKDITVPMFDYSILVQKGISQSNLPLDSVLINKPFSLYEEYAFFIWAIVLIIAAQGVTIFFLVLNKISKLRAEKALQVSESKYRTIFETANEGIWVGDKQQTTILINKVLSQMLGYSESELIGRPIHELFYEDELEDHALQMSKRAKGIDTVYERKFKHKDGSTLWCIISAKAVLDDDGDFDGSFSMITDISDRKLVEERILHAKEKAEAANMVKNEFLANMSHELRTPLNGILGMLQLLQATPQNVEQKKFIGNAITASRRLTRLLSDILDISCIEARKMEIRKEVFLIRHALTGVMELLHNTAMSKRLDLTLYIDEGIPYEVIGDSTRLQQVLINLVGNALKFTQAGFVKVEVLLLQATDSRSRIILFMVSDSGIGIPDDKLDSVFDSFTQAEGSYSRQYQGAGLGLQIVKRLTLLMKGSISIESEEGLGTTVYVSIPFDLPDLKMEQQPVAPVSSCGSNFKRVLVVEDDRLNRISLSRLLKKLGLEVGEAEDGIKALKALESTSYDIIFMDIQMPNMDGLEAMKQIRTESRFKDISRIPIVAITAYAMDGDRENLLNAGMNDYISKPFELVDLKRVLSITS